MELGRMTRWGRGYIDPEDEHGVIYHTTLIISTAGITCNVALWIGFTAFRNKSMFYISSFGTTHEQSGFELEAQLK